MPNVSFPESQLSDRVSEDLGRPTREQLFDVTPFHSANGDWAGCRHIFVKQDEMGAQPELYLSLVITLLNGREDILEVFDSSLRTDRWG